jgi:hypothetical protein
MAELKAAAVPPEMSEVFQKAQGQVAGYFAQVAGKPELGRIEIAGDRYMLVRADSMTMTMSKVLAEIYGDRGADQIRYKVAKAIGISEARMFHKRFGVTQPMEKLGIGPVYFSYSGWAFVELLEPSQARPDDQFMIFYHHPHSFEAEPYLAAGIKTDRMVCQMNAGYSAGWIEESFSMPIDARELTCEAKGDKECLFVMAHPSRLLTAVDNLKRMIAEGKIGTHAEVLGL